MTSIRVMNSKPNHSGSYSQQRKQQKERNHTHQLYVTKNTKGQSIELCRIPKCKKKSFIR